VRAEILSKESGLQEHVMIQDTQVLELEVVDDMIEKGGKELKD